MLITLRGKRIWGGSFQKKCIYPLFAFCSVCRVLHSSTLSIVRMPPELFKVFKNLVVIILSLARNGPSKLMFWKSFLWACILKNMFVRSINLTLQLYYVHIHVSGFVRVLISGKMKTFEINFRLELVHHCWVFFVRQLNYPNLPQLIRVHDVIGEFRVQSLLKLKFVHVSLHRPSTNQQ